MRILQKKKKKKKKKTCLALFYFLLTLFRLVFAVALSDCNFRDVERRETLSTAKISSRIAQNTHTLLLDLLSHPVKLHRKSAMHGGVFRYFCPHFLYSLSNPAKMMCHVSSSRPSSCRF